MTTTELVLEAIGLAPDLLNWLDKISDAIDIDYSSEDVRDAIAETSDHNDPKTIGTTVAFMVMEKIVDHFKEKYPNFDENKFEFEINGFASEVYYDSQTICSEDDMDHIMEDEEAA